ncbi:MAG: hypothetical protein V4525_14780 [Pseudomonadota bacterium]
MFSFFSKKKPWTSPRAMENWIQKQLPVGDIHTSQQAALELLKDYLQSESALGYTCFPALWLLSECIESLLQQLMNTYLQNHRTSPTVEQLTREGLFELSQRLSQVYEPIIEEEPEVLLKTLKTEGIARSLVYYMHYKSLQAKLRLYRFEPWMPAHWKTLHKSYSLAEKLNAHNIIIRLFEPTDSDSTSITTSVELEYAHLLLLQLLNVGSFDANHIEHAHLWLMLNSNNIHIEKTVNAEGFAVNLNSSEGLIRASKIANNILASPQHSEHIRFVNTYAITTLLEQEIHATRELLQETIDPGPMHVQLSLLTKWYGLWNHNNHFWNRKGDREKVQDSHVWMVDDWNAMTQCCPPIMGSESSAPPPIPVYTVGDQCKIIDKSRYGYGLIALANESRPFRLGMLILLFDEEGAEWSVCVLRRIKKLNLDQIELGIEILGRSISSMKPYIPKKAKSYEGFDGYEIDSASPVENPNEDHTPTLYIKPQEETRAGDVPSLILLKKDYQRNKIFNLVLDSGLFKIKLDDAIETGTDWVWCKFSVQTE